MIDNALKTIASTDDELVVANYIIIFGGRDLEWVRSGPNQDGSKGEYFSENTDLESSYTKAGIFHLDWEHGIGEHLDGKGAPGEDDVLGYVDWKTARKDERGWWVERVLTRRNKYVQWIEDLVRAGMIGTSSEAIAGKVNKTKSGEIKAWPLKRDTLTVEPAEPRMLSENVIVALKNLSINPQTTTLAAKTARIRGDLDKLLSDTTAVIGSAERPLSNIKRQELVDLLETFSSLDAVRSDIKTILFTPRVSAKRTLHEYQEAKRRLTRILE